jgi:hypothetical protein
MIRRNLQNVTLLLTPALLVVAFAFAPASANSPAPRGWTDRDHHCVPVGGAIITNLGALAPDEPHTTLGPATGDLAGAVAATVRSGPDPSNGAFVFKVQHHWVTASGETIAFDQATAKTAMLSQTRFAIIDYSAQINGNGTGKFAGATGELNFIGELDLNAGVALRYFGEVCYADRDN